MTNQIKIRQAEPLDVSNLTRLLLQAHHDQENLYPDPDEYMALNWVTTVISEGYVLVAEKAGRLIGTVAVTNYRFPWSRTWYLYVDWIYVSKSFREGGVFDALLKALHAYADQGKKPVPIFGGISSGKDPRLKDRLMKMNGYHYLGGQFIREEIADGRREQTED